MAVVPVFVMVGEGIFAGSKDRPWLITNGDIDYLWTERQQLPAPYARNIFIYNHVSGGLSLYIETLSNTEWGAPNNTMHGPDVTLVTPLSDQYPAGVYLFKYTLAAPVGGGTGPRWGKQYNERYGAMLAAKNNFFQAIVNAGHQPSVKAIFCSYGYSPQNLATFQADLTQLVKDLQQDWTTDAVPAVIMERPSPYKLWPVDTVNTIRGAIDSLQVSVPRCKVANGDSIPLQVDRVYPTGEGNLQLGRVLHDAYIAATNPIEFVEGSSLPLYLLLGQSQTRGVTIVQTLLLDKDPRHYGPQSGQWIWNGQLQKFELFDSQSNTNTLGAGNAGVFGPEVTFLRKIKERHPNGVALIKIATDGSCLGEPDLVTTQSWGKQYGLIWNTLRDNYLAARTYALNQMGLVLIPQGIVFDQGESDTSEPRASAYEANLKKFIHDVRSLVSVRVAPPDVPVILSRLIDTGAWSPQGVAKVRAAQAAVAASDPQVRVVDFDDREWLYPICADNIHFTGFAAINRGRAFAAAFEGVDMGCSAVGAGAAPDGAGLVTSPNNLQTSTEIRVTVRVGGSITVNLTKSTKLYRGNSRRIVFVVTDATGLPIRLAGATATWTLFPGPGNTNGQVQLATGGLGVETNDLGEMIVDLSAANAANIGTATGTAWWRHTATVTLGGAVTTIAAGAVEIQSTQ